MKFRSIRIAALALYTFASAASSYSDNEYIPPAYNEEYRGTIHFRHQLRHYGIPTRFLHDPNVTPDAMVLAFYDMPSGYMNNLPDERRKRDNFAKDLAAYLGAHRSEWYKDTFRRLRDKLLMARRARKAHEKRVMMNIRQPVKEKILTGQPIADYDLEQTEESRQILNDIIEKDLIESGIVVKHYAPDALAVVMQKQLRYFDKFDPDELKKVIRRISAYLRDKMSDNYEFLWKKKLHLYKRTAHFSSVDATMEQLQPREGVFKGVGITDDNWHESNIVYAESQADRQGAERQLHREVAHGNDHWPYSAAMSYSDAESVCHPWEYRDSHHWEPESSDIGDSSAYTSTENNLGSFSSSPNTLQEPFEDHHGAPSSPGYEGYNDLRKLWYKD